MAPNHVYYGMLTIIIDFLEIIKKKKSSRFEFEMYYRVVRYGIDGMFRFNGMGFVYTVV